MLTGGCLVVRARPSPTAGRLVSVTTTKSGSRSTVCQLEVILEELGNCGLRRKGASKSWTTSCQNSFLPQTDVA